MNQPTNPDRNTTTPRARTRRRATVIGGSLLLTVATLSACGSSNSASTTPPSVAGDATALNATDTTARASVAGDTAALVATEAATTAANAPATEAGSASVLPVTSNPISNNATAATLKIDSVLVENNVDANGKATDDHLEIAVSNTGTMGLVGFDVFYTFTDPTTATAESYYTKLPADFTVAPGAKRVIHFDSTGQPDHFPINKFSLYKTSTNALDVTVEVSAKGAAVATQSVKKDKGGAEAAD